MSGQRPSPALIARVPGRIRNRIPGGEDGRRAPSTFGRPSARRLEGAPSLWRGESPARGVEHGEAALVEVRAALAARVSWIPTGPRGNIYRDKPSAVRRRAHGTALAEIIVAAAAIDPDARLETTTQTQDRADDTHASAGHGGGGAATRSARRARAIQRVPSAPRLHVAANSVVTTFAEVRPPTRSAATLAASQPPPIQRRALLGRPSVSSFDNILDAKPSIRRRLSRHAPARAGGRWARDVADKGADGRLEFRQKVQAAFEKGAGRVASAKPAVERRRTASAAAAASSLLSVIQGERPNLPAAAQQSVHHP